MRLINPQIRVACVVLFVALAPTLVVAGALGIAPFVEIGTSHDSNLFRLDDDTDTRSRTGGVARSDTITRGSIGAAVAWPISRQRVVVGGQVSEVRYNRFSQLDHSEHQARAALEFEVGPAVTGTVSYRRERRLDDFGNRDTTRSDFIQESHPQIETFIDVAPSWRVHTRAGQLRLDHSLESQDAFDREENSLLLEVQRLGLPGSVFGTGVEYTDGKYPGRNADELLSREFTQATAFASSNWRYSGLSTFTGRLGYTERDNSGGGNRDFSGITGNLGYVRTISGKTQASVEIFRQIFSVDEVDANFARDTGVLAQLLWKYSEKLGLTARLRHFNREFQGLPGFSDTREDEIDELTAELLYQPSPLLALVFDVAGENRDSSEPDESYDALRVGLALRLTLDTD